MTIWFAVEGDTIFLATADSRRSWVRNVKARPEIELQVDGEHFAGRAEELTDSGAIGHARALISAKYWYVMPLFYLMALLSSLGITSDRTAAFRMRPSATQA